MKISQQSPTGRQKRLVREARSAPQGYAVEDGGLITRNGDIPYGAVGPLKHGFTPAGFNTKIFYIPPGPVVVFMMGSHGQPEMMGQSVQLHFYFIDQWMRRIRLQQVMDRGAQSLVFLILCVHAGKKYEKTGSYNGQWSEEANDERI